MRRMKIITEESTQPYNIDSISSDEKWLHNKKSESKGKTSDD